MRLLSRIKLLVLPIGLVAIAVLGVLWSRVPKIESSTYRGATFQGLVEAALSDFKSNDVMADSAPKQQVVAAWATKDLLTVSGYQNASQVDGLTAINSNLSALVKSSNDSRTPRLVLLGVLALCWIGMWSAVPSVDGRKRPSDLPAPPLAPSAPSASAE